jgi:hypothetical protein
MKTTCTMLLLLALILQAPVRSQDPQPPAGPEPIVIQRIGGPPIIPDVPRDQVIGFALYTVQNRVLKLSAQLYPLQTGEERQVNLEIQTDGVWKPIARADVDEKGWLATFRIEDWKSDQTVPYRVTHAGGASFSGVIRRDPVEKDEIVVAAFTGNSNQDRGMREDIVRNVQAQDPDLLFFSGDQSYDHKDHTAAWLLFGRQFGQIIKDRPTITIPDDHDVGQGNLWGEGGKVALLEGGADGGYVMPPEYVKMVERAQTSHLPDPYDPTPIQQGIGVYYTSLNVGGIDFAIVEDRKWKTGPAGLIPRQGPRPDHINDPRYDRRAIDVPEATLLGERQLGFLREWGQNWEGAQMKAVLSQTVFAGGAHLHGQSDQRLLADLDSNGWPQSGRAEALIEFRKFFGFHIAGDQHLATVIHHGVNSWEDSGYSFCVPSIVNYYGRWWWPLEAAENRDPGSPLPFTGRYHDGLGNKLTMLAYANPAKANYNAAGYGLVRFRKSTRQITIECWPRHIDVRKPDARQFPGWPVTIHQEDNYGRSPMAYLPTLVVRGATDPIVQVVDEYLNQVVYTLRIKGSEWRPKVFREATYTVKVTSGQRVKVLERIPSVAESDSKTMEVVFD